MPETAEMCAPLKHLHQEFRWEFGILESVQYTKNP